MRELFRGVVLHLNYGSAYSNDSAINVSFPSTSSTRSKTAWRFQLIVFSILWRKYQFSPPKKIKINKMPTIRNPFRKAPHPTPTVQINGSTESLASSTTTTIENFGANVFGRPHSPLSLSTEFNYKGSNSPTTGDAKPISIVRAKVDEYAGEYKLSGKLYLYGAESYTSS